MLPFFMRSASMPARVRATTLVASRVASPAVALGSIRTFATSPRARQDNVPNPPSPNDKFLTSNNAYYVEEMYRQWKEDPGTVHASWNAYFLGLKRGLRSQDAVVLPPALDDASLIQAPLTSAQVQNVDSQLKVCPCALITHPLPSPHSPTFFY